MRTVHVVVPAGVDDPTGPSGGNVYDRRICAGLSRLGWQVIEHEAAGGWPRPDPAATNGLAQLIEAIDDGSTVLIDGLIASAAPEVLVPAADRLELVIVVHMIFGGATEAAVLGAASRILTTSRWTRDQLVSRYGLSPAGISVAEPGADAAPLAPGSHHGGELLCVAAVIPAKGHGVLITGLTMITDLQWRLVCVGSLDRDAQFAEELDHRVDAAGLRGRISFTGPQTGDDLDRAYAAADVLVLASRAETYGMVVTEALARGLPVITTAVGGLPEAVGRTAVGHLPGVIVPPDDGPALAAALRAWLTDAALRQQLRGAAWERRKSLSSWDVTADRIAQVLPEPAMS